MVPLNQGGYCQPDRRQVDVQTILSPLQNAIFVFTDDTDSVVFLHLPESVFAAHTLRWV